VDERLIKEAGRDYSGYETYKKRVVAELLPATHELVPLGQRVVPGVHEYLDSDGLWKKVPSSWVKTLGAQSKLVRRPCEKKDAVNTGDKAIGVDLNAPVKVGDKIRSPDGRVLGEVVASSVSADVGTSIVGDVNLQAHGVSNLKNQLPGLGTSVLTIQQEKERQNKMSNSDVGKSMKDGLMMSIIAGAATTFGTDQLLTYGVNKAVGWAADGDRPELAEMMATPQFTAILKFGGPALMLSMMVIAADDDSNPMIQAAAASVIPSLKMAVAASMADGMKLLAEEFLTQKREAVAVRDEKIEASRARARLAEETGEPLRERRVRKARAVGKAREGVPARSLT